MDPAPGRAARPPPPVPDDRWTRGPGQPPARPRAPMPRRRRVRRSRLAAPDRSVGSTPQGDRAGGADRSERSSIASGSTRSTGRLGSCELGRERLDPTGEQALFGEPVVGERFRGLELGDRASVAPIRSRRRARSDSTSRPSAMWRCFRSNSADAIAASAFGPGRRRLVPQPRRRAPRAGRPDEAPTPRPAPPAPAPCPRPPHRPAARAPPPTRRGGSGTTATVDRGPTGPCCRRRASGTPRHDPRRPEPSTAPVVGAG